MKTFFSLIGLGPLPPPIIRIGWTLVIFCDRISDLKARNIFLSRNALLAIGLEPPYHCLAKPNPDLTLSKYAIIIVYNKGEEMSNYTNWEYYKKYGDLVDDQHTAQKIGDKWMKANPENTGETIKLIIRIGNDLIDGKISTGHTDVINIDEHDIKNAADFKVNRGSLKQALKAVALIYKQKGWEAHRRYSNSYYYLTLKLPRKMRI